MSVGQGQITTSTGTVVCTLSSDSAVQSENRANVTIYGTYGSVTGVIEGTTGPDANGTTAWQQLAALNRLTNAFSTGTLSPSDNSTTSWSVDCGGSSQMRFRATGYASGTANIYISAYRDPVSPLQCAVASGGTLPTTTITSTSANALAVGANGTTNPVFNVDASTTSVATGLNVKGAAAGSGVAIAAISSGTNEGLTLDAKGSGLIQIGSVSTGGANVRIPVATVAATGSNNISNAAAVAEGFTYVTGANNVASVKLPVASVGAQVTVVNDTYTATLNVYPQTNSAINNLAANAVYVLGNGGKRTFYAGTSTLWFSDPSTIV